MVIALNSVRLAGGPARPAPMKAPEVKVEQVPAMAMAN
jgi:hypothetical protein